MIEYDIFPNMKRKCVTFSFIVGHKNDIQIVSLLNKYGIKATFYLEKDNLIDEEADLYKGQDLSYSFSKNIHFMSENIRECIKEKRYFVEMFSSHPTIGALVAEEELKESVKNILQNCGIKFCCLDHTAMNCKIPEDFMAWKPSCNIKNGIEMCDAFLSRFGDVREEPLLHILGKSSELEKEDWLELENILKHIGNRKEIWYATNTQVYEYVCAQRNLLISADEKIFYNPSNIDIWIKRNCTESFCVPAGGKINYRNIE